MPMGRDELSYAERRWRNISYTWLKSKGSSLLQPSSGSKMKRKIVAFKRASFGCPKCGARKTAGRTPKCSNCGIKMVPIVGG